jgi:hypothetical protein
MYPSKMNHTAIGRVATVGDSSGYSVECLIVGDDLSLNNLKLSQFTEFIFFGGTRVICKGIFFINFLKTQHYLGIFLCGKYISLISGA